MYYIAWNGEIWSSPFRPCDLRSDSTGGLIDKQGTSVTWDADGYRGENWVPLDAQTVAKMAEVRLLALPNTEGSRADE